MKSTDGSIVGHKGVKYGLHVPGAPPVNKKVAQPKPVNVFGADSDSDDDVGAQVARQGDKKRAAAKVQQMYEAALAEDASVFDYDGVYDSLQQAKVQPRQQEKIARQSRYIAQLKEQAEQRKRESDVAFERKQLKDRVKEDHLFADKEVFVTAAYKKKLEEQQKWLESEKRKEEEEQRQDVRKVGHMGNFYANLLTSNVAFGTAAVPKEEPLVGGDQTGRDGSATEHGGRESSPADDGELEEQELVAAAAKAGVVLDKYELMRMEAEKAMRRQGRGAAAGVAGEAAAERQQQGSQPGSDGVAEQAVERGVAEADEAAATEAAAAAAAALQAGKRRNDESSVQSAKERYLARKRHQTG